MSDFELKDMQESVLNASIVESEDRLKELKSERTRRDARPWDRKLAIAIAEHFPMIGLTSENEKEKILKHIVKVLNQHVERIDLVDVKGVGYTKSMMEFYQRLKALALDGGTPTQSWLNNNIKYIQLK